MCKIFTLILLWIPIFFTNPVSQNITALQQDGLILYILWGLTAMIVLAVRFKPGPWFVLLMLGFIVPWRKQGPGYINDLHVWLQIAGIVWLYCLELHKLIYTNDKKARTCFAILAVCVTVMGICGHVSGLAETLWITGILLFVPQQNQSLLPARNQSEQN